MKNNYFTVRLVGRPRYVPFDDQDFRDRQRALGEVSQLLRRSLKAYKLEEVVSLWRPVPHDQLLEKLSIVGIGAAMDLADEEEQVA